MNHMIDELTRSCYVYGLSTPAHDHLSAVMALESLSRQTLSEDVCRLPTITVLDVPAAHDLKLRDGCSLIVADSPLLLSSASPRHVTSRLRGCCFSTKWHPLLDSTWFPAAVSIFAGDLPAVDRIPCYLALYTLIASWGLCPMRIVVHLALCQCAPFALLCFQSWLTLSLRPAVRPSYGLFVERSAEPIDNPARPHWPLPTVHTTRAQNQTGERRVSSSSLLTKQTYQTGPQPKPLL